MAPALRQSHQVNMRIIKYDDLWSSSQFPKDILLTAGTFPALVSSAYTHKITALSQPIIAKVQSSQVSINPHIQLYISGILRHLDFQKSRR